MKQYSLKISSKNEKSLRNFLHFFFNHLKTKFNIIQKLTTTHNNKKIVTLLKSPHVNKAAQEHFETRIFKKQILTKSFDSEKNLIFLKKILNRLFQDISVNLEFITNTTYKTELLIFCSDNFRLFTRKSYKTNLKRCKQKPKLKKFNLEKNSLFNLTKFLNTISIFGEILSVSIVKHKIKSE